MTGESLSHGPEKMPDVELLTAMAGFVMIVQHYPKSPESRSYDLWLDEAASLRVEDQADHLTQRFKERIRGDEALKASYIAAQQELSEF